METNAFVSHTEHLDASFVNYLLDSIETPLAIDEDEQIPDLFVNIVLAFNLLFLLPGDSIVMRVLAEHGTAKVFTEKVMLLVNRGGTKHFVKHFNDTLLYVHVCVHVYVRACVCMCASCVVCV